MRFVRFCVEIYFLLRDVHSPADDDDDHDNEFLYELNRVHAGKRLPSFLLYSRGVAVRIQIRKLSVDNEIKVDEGGGGEDGQVYEEETNRMCRRARLTDCN